MKKMFSLLLCAALLAGCSNTVTEVTPVTQPPAETIPAQQVVEYIAPAYVSRFDAVTEITLSDSGITVDGPEETDAVFTSNDILYYEDRDTYDSGNPYGEGTGDDKHSADEAAAHTVVNITAPGAYRVTGKLSAGQLRIDLGEDAFADPDAVVELILSDADITCTVAPAILFLNTYECDNSWSVDTAKADVDTTAAGANLILEGSSTVNGSYVAKIFKDKEGEKKLWKQDGAVYSYMSLNVFGPGSLELNAANEGLDTELHLTINGGNIIINSDNDGINTNEDGVSVTTFNGGSLTIHAGLGAEGDGIDSNGYLVINGGTVVSAAKPMADAGLDSDLGSFIHGGTVIAMGSTMDWAESDSRQVTMNLQFARQQAAGSKITITREDGTQIFSFVDDGSNARGFSGLILSHPNFRQGETYHVYVDGVQMAYTGTDVAGFPGGFGGRPCGMGGMPEDFDPETMPEGFEPGQMPEGFDPSQMPEGFDPSQMGGGRGQRPADEERTPPEGFDPGQMPEGFGNFDPENMPEGFRPENIPEGFAPGQMPEGMAPPEGSGQDNRQSGEASTEFYMNDTVNAFSGITNA